jgi:hypothetical protein
MFEFLSAATTKMHSDGTLQIHSAAARYVAWSVLFLLLSLPAFLLWRRRVFARAAAVVGLTSFVIPIIVLPSLAIERIVVSPRELGYTVGIWFSPIRKTIPLDTVEKLEERVESIPQRGFERRDTYWIFHYRSGRVFKLDLSDMLTANRASIKEYLWNLGIEIEKG